MDASVATYMVWFAILTVACTALYYKTSTSSSATALSGLLPISQTAAGLMSERNMTSLVAPHSLVSWLQMISRSFNPYIWWCTSP